MLKIIALFIVLLPLSISNPKVAAPHNTAIMSSESTVSIQKSKKKGKIQVALLLDTSNSMDGLIDQAKSQIWKNLLHYLVIS